MKKTIILFAFACLLLSAGKKEVLNHLYVISPAVEDSNVYGNVQITKILTDNGIGRYYSDMITASFKNYVDSGNVPVTSVAYDSVKLKLREDLGKAYFDTSGRQPFVGKTWEVNATGVIPTFSYTPTNDAPFYNGYASLSDTLLLGSDFIVPMSGISNATNVSIQVSDGVNVVNQDIYLSSTGIARGVYIPNINNSNITFSSSNLSVLNSTSTGFLQIIVTNVDIQEFKGKKIAFTNMFLYRKRNFVIE